MLFRCFANIAEFLQCYREISPEYAEMKLSNGILFYESLSVAGAVKRGEKKVLRGSLPNLFLDPHQHHPQYHKQNAYDARNMNGGTIKINFSKED